MVHSETRESSGTVCIRADRGKALRRAILWSLAVLAAGIPAWIALARFAEPSTAISNRLVDFSVAVLGIPPALCCLYCALKAIRWLVFSSWPGAVGVFADRSSITFRLGPFGTQRFDCSRIGILYPYDRQDDSEESSFESFLPEEEQRATLLPELTHPETSEPLDLVILRFARGTEAEVASALRELIEDWRRSQEDSNVGTRTGESGT